MDMTRLRQEAPVTVEHLHRILLAEYYMNESSDKLNQEYKIKQEEINTKTIIRYVMAPTNVEQLKRRLLGINNPDVRDYFFDRFNHCLDALKELNELADANEKQAQKIGDRAVVAGGALTAGGVALATGGVALARSAPALAGTAASTLAASALAYGADMILAGGIFTVTGLVGWWVVGVYKKQKIGLKNPIRNAETIVSRIKMLREG